MKIGFWISVALNVVLVAGLATWALRDDKPASPAVAPAKTSRPEPATTAGLEPRPEPSARIPEAEGVAFDLGDGRQLAFAPEFTGLLKQLRAAGVSERLLVNLVQAELTEQWMTAQQAMQRKFMRGEITQAEQQRFWSQYMAARNEAVEALLGPEALARWQRDNMMRWAQAAGLSVPPETAEAVGKVNKEWGMGGERGRELSAMMQSGEIDQIEYQEQQAAMQKEFERRMTELLGAEGFAALRRASDWQYGNMRRQLRDMNLSEQQFDAVYDTIQQFGRRQQELQRETQAGQPRDFGALQQEQERELQRLLGARYEEFMKFQDYRYQQLRQYAPAWQLSHAEIEHVYETVQQTAKGVAEYRQSAAGQPVDWTQINEFKREAEAELRRYLGDERFERLKRAGVINFDHHPTRFPGRMPFFGGHSVLSIPSW